MFEVIGLKAKKLKAEKDALAERTKREETALSIIETLTLGDSDEKTP